MNRNVTIAIVLFVLASVFVTRARRSAVRDRAAPTTDAEPHAGDRPFARPKSVSARPAAAAPPSRAVMATPRRVIVASRVPAPSARGHEPHAGRLIPFVIEDGLAVAMGDVALGVPQEMRPGITEVKRPDRWPSPVLAYHVQPDLPDPERVTAAFQLFAGTPIRFEPYVDQRDVLVFQVGTGACKSYLGRVGGKQPIWLSPNCGPVEIAHEIMHALGFIHEQNREDRDDYVRVRMDNVEPGNDINFEKLPREFMGLTGLGPFDYTSIMMYPKTMFGVGGRETLESIRAGVDIEPGRGLSPVDRDRLTRAFSNQGEVGR